MQEKFTSTNILEDFDWRLDFKVASKQQERIKQPMLYVKMELSNGNQEGSQQTHKDVLF